MVQLLVLNCAEKTRFSGVQVMLYLNLAVLLEASPRPNLFDGIPNPGAGPFRKAQSPVPRTFDLPSRTQPSISHLSQDRELDAPSVFGDQSRPGVPCEAGHGQRTQPDQAC